MGITSIDSHEHTLVSADVTRGSDCKSDAIKWIKKYVQQLRWVDVTIIGCVLLAAQLVRFGFEKSDLEIGSLAISYWLYGVFIGVSWDNRSIRVIDAGTDEFRLALTATTGLFGMIAVVAYAFDLRTALGYLLLAPPIGGLGILLARWVQSAPLHRKRRSGFASGRVFVVVRTLSPAHLVDSLARQPSAGFLPVAVNIPGLANRR